MKIRIGISAGGENLGPEAMVALAQGITGTGFDSLWLPEVLTRPGPDPLVGLAWVVGRLPGAEDRDDHAAARAATWSGWPRRWRRSTCCRAATSC